MRRWDTATSATLTMTDLEVPLKRLSTSDSTSLAENVSRDVDLSVVWKDAVAEYEKTTGVKLEVLGGLNTVDGVINEISVQEIKFMRVRHSGSNVDKFRTLVAQSLGPINALSTVVAHAAKQVFPPSEAIFAAIRYLISTANAVSGDFDKIMDFFEDLKSYLTRLRIWEGQVPPIAGLQEAITMVFKSVLVLCGICTRYIRGKRIVKAFRALAQGEDADLKEAYDHFHKMVEREEGIVRNATLFNTERIKAATSSVQVDMTRGLGIAEQINHNVNGLVHYSDALRESLDRKETQTERDNTLKWFSTLNFRDTQRAIQAKRHTDTGHWLLQNATFQEWLRGHGSAILWCPGIPGSGKSVMTSTVVSHIEEHTDMSKAAVAYVYCNYKESRTHTESEIWSSITAQLAAQCHPIPAEVKAFRDKFIDKQSHPTTEERMALIKSICEKFEKSYILIDALDECPEDSRDGLLSSARELETCSRLFLTSRRVVDMKDFFPGLRQIEISASNEDIRATLDSVMKTDRRMKLFIAKDPTLRDEIIESIQKQAQGMFLLAHLQMVHLCNQSSSKRVRSTLQSLAKDVWTFYGDAMSRIEDLESLDQELAVKALSFIFCARRVLSMQELLFALSIELGDTEFDETALPEISILLSVGAGLIRFDETSGSVSLVHQTLHEFLQKHPQRLLPDFERAMAETCITYLTLNEFGTGPSETDEELECRLNQHRLLDYASLNWGDHAAVDQDPDVMRLAVNFMSSRPNFMSSLQVLYMPDYRMAKRHQQYPEDYSSLHAAAFWGLDTLILSLCTNDAIDTIDETRSTALHLASQRGHVQTIDLLIATGADTSCRNSRGETALMCAARNGKLPAVETLLSRGVDALVLDDDGWTPLHGAIISGHEEVVERLLQHFMGIGLDIDQRNSALILAAEAGSGKAVQLLLDAGADIECKDDQGSPPLHWAVPEGRVEAVRVLVKNGADVNSIDNFDNTPLHWAISACAIMRLLLENGAKPNAQNDTGQSPLHWAAQEGRGDALKMMVDFGANVNDADKNGFTALHAVALNGRVDLVNLLLESGADISARDNHGWTPLYAAAVKQHREVMGLLISAAERLHVPPGAHDVPAPGSKEQAKLQDIASQKSLGSTVMSGLRCAAGFGHQEKVLNLLNNGADMDAQDEVGGSTALCAAAYSGQLEVAGLLVQHGADVNRRDRSGWTPLHRAVEHGQVDIASYLIHKGADVNAEINSWTPALLAAMHGYGWILHQLIHDTDADLFAKDYNDRSLLHWSAWREDPVVVRNLLERGLDPTARDRDGKIPLDLVEDRDCQTAKILAAAGCDAQR